MDYKLIFEDSFLIKIPGLAILTLVYIFLYSLNIYSTVTDLAKFLGLSTSSPLATDV